MFRERDEGELEEKSQILIKIKKILKIDKDPLFF